MSRGPIACDKHRLNPVKGYSACAGCEVERLTRERDKARAELAEVKGREPVGKVVAISGFRQAAVLLDAYQTASAGQSLVGSKLYALPPASPDVEGLVKALERIHKQAVELECKQIPCSPEQREFADIASMADTALSTWRQAQEGKA